MKTLVLLLVMVVLPAFLFQAGVWVMGAISKRAVVGETLNQRLGGYSKDRVEQYWGEARAKQGERGLHREMRFLEVDLIFPFVYGAGLAASLLIGWVLIGRPFAPGWCLLPVGVVMLADWAENLIQIEQLKHFLEGRGLIEASINVASAATRIKLAGLFVCMAFVAVLLLWAAWVQFRGGKSA